MPHLFISKEQIQKEKEISDGLGALEHLLEGDLKGSQHPGLNVPKKQQIKWISAVLISPLLWFIFCLIGAAVTTHQSHLFPRFESNYDRLQKGSQELQG